MKNNGKKIMALLLAGVCTMSGPVLPLRAAVSVEATEDLD